MEDLRVDPLVIGKKDKKTSKKVITNRRDSLKALKPGSSGYLMETMEEEQEDRDDKVKILLHCIRHGEAEHNLKLPGRADILNPVLTPHGHAQCLSVLQNFPHMSTVTQILCSPMQRTLQTALECFSPLYDRGVKILAWDQLRETGRHWCNTGDPLPVVRRKMEGLPVDLKLVPIGWEENKEKDKTGRIRAATVTFELYDLKDTILEGGVWRGIRFEKHKGPGKVEILIVSHGDFLRRLTGDKYRNCQFRSYEFSSKDDTFTFKETKESAAREHVPLPETPAPPALFTLPNINIEIGARGGKGKENEKEGAMEGSSRSRADFTGEGMREMSLAEAIADELHVEERGRDAGEAS